MLPLLLPAFEIGSSIYEFYESYETSDYREDMTEQLNKNSSILTGLEEKMSEQSFILSGLQTSMGVLGATSVASLSVSTFSLYKINQISKDIKNLSSQIDSGFIDMKHFISEEISQLINHQQQVKLSEAYEYYQKASQNFQRSLTISDMELRKHSLFKSMEHLDNALIIYDSQKKFQDLSAAGYLRQLEIIIIIESLKSQLYITMGENSAGKDHYSDLYNRVNKELKKIANYACKDTIDLILLDTFLLKNNDMKLIECRLKS